MPGLEAGESTVSVRHVPTPDYMVFIPSRVHTQKEMRMPHVENDKDKESSID